MKGQRATLPQVNQNSVPILSLVLGVAFAAAWLGCDRNTEEFVEGEKPRAPDLARIFPESDSAARPGIAPPAARPMGGRADVPQRGAPPVRTGIADVGSNGISGTISIDPALAGSAPSAGMLFVIARPVGVTAGPPLAVLRIPSPRFPLAFEIGPANVMIPSMRFEGDIAITARLDGDGNAMTKLPGDLSGASAGALRPGAAGVTIVLDRKR